MSLKIMTRMNSDISVLSVIKEINNHRTHTHGLMANDPVV